MAAKVTRLGLIAVLVLMGVSLVSPTPLPSMALGPSADKSDLLYSTFLGGESADYANAIAMDAEGNEYIAGSTCSEDFLNEAVSLQLTAPCTAFIAKFDSSKVLVFSTKVGGDPSFDIPYALALDKAGNIYAAGTTASPNFPTTPEAFDQTFEGWSDAFVLKLDSEGNLVYSTFLGGSYSSSDADGSDWAKGIAVNESGQVFVTGSTGSIDFPTSSNAYDKTYAGGLDDAFLVQLNETGSELLYGTFLGRKQPDIGTALALDHAGDVIVTGSTASPLFPTTSGAFQTELRVSNCRGISCYDVFVSKFSASTGALVYSTLIGGEKTETSNALAIDESGAVYLTGKTESRDFPVTAGAFDTTLNDTRLYNGDAFVLKLKADGSALHYSTFLGGKRTDEGLGIALDRKGAAHVVGLTTSNNFPTTRGAYDRKCNKPCKYLLDAFLIKLNPRGTDLRYGTFLGGGGNSETLTTRADFGLESAFDPDQADPGHESASSIALDADGIAHIVGSTKSTDFPTTPDAYDSTLGSYVDGFVLKIKPTFRK